MDILKAIDNFQKSGKFQSARFPEEIWVPLVKTADRFVPSSTLSAWESEIGAQLEATVRGHKDNNYTVARYVLAHEFIEQEEPIHTNQGLQEFVSKFNEEKA